MKKFKKLILLGGLVSALALPSAAAAYSGSYSFDISYSVTGTKDHNLASKSTWTTAKANTYSYSGEVQSAKSSYTVSIVKLLKSYVTSPIPADGYSYKKSYGTISSGTYNVTVNKYSSTGDKVKGSGTINQ
jgi:hypothetical protein